MTRGQFGGPGYDPISPVSQGMEGTDGRYQVRDGDTLAGIAAAQWGDASLWYLIAEANGLSGSEYLAAGTNLIIPDKVTNIHNRASTFEVYDPNHALGDLSPSTINTAKPHKGNKCGVFGQILLVAVAVAVSALTAGALSGLSPILIGAISGAAGSVVSQGLGVITGIQDKFSFKGVALAAIGGAVGGGVGSAMKGAMLGSQFVGNAVRGAVGSALTQGIGVALGLQKHFSFASVAAAAIGAGIGGAVGDKLGAKPLSENHSLSNHIFNAVGGAANAIANAATRSVINGSDFGDNLIAALPDVIGSTIGNMLAYGVSGTGGATAAATSVQKDTANRTDERTFGSSAGLVAPGVTADGAASPTAGTGGGQISLESATSASNAILGAIPNASAATDGAFGVGDRYRTGHDPLTLWLGAEGVKTGRYLDFDDYVGRVWKGDVDGVAALLSTEAQGVAAGQGNNQMIMLGYLSGQGSRYAPLVASAMHSKSDIAAIAGVLGAKTDSLARAFDTGSMLAAMHMAELAPSGFKPTGYVLTNLAQPRMLNGWERTGAAINGLGHTVLTGLLGVATVGTSPLFGTGVGGLVPIGLGAGTLFEADNAYTNWKMAWTGRD
jgi:hypothetical protein